MHLWRTSPAAFWGTILVRTDGAHEIEATGWADLEARRANDARTRYNIASITKLFTALAICRLAEAGDVRLDHTVSTVLPKAGIESADEMTIAHLLNHQAGFPEETASEDTDSDSWIEAARVPLEYRPGASWGYSNVGYALLGAIIERISGRSYYDVVAELVFRAAGMAATAFDDPAVAESPRAVGYLFGDRRGEQPIGDNRGLLGRGTPYGYAYSTVGDLERLVDAVAAGRLVNSASSHRVLAGDVPTNQAGRTAGFGMFSETVGRTRVATLSGAGPGISAWLDYAPSAGFLSITLSNLPKPAAHDVGAGLRAAFLR